MIARGGERILAMRRQGRRPGEDVVISLVGPMEVEWLVEPDLPTAHDWIWVVDLNLWVVVNTDTPQEGLRALLRGLRGHRPRNIRLWLADARMGFELWFHPTPETVTGPPDRWVWLMEATRLMPFQEKVMEEVFGAAIRGLTA